MSVGVGVRLRDERIESVKGESRRDTVRTARVMIRVIVT
jgi:aspartate carbamoyltransferase catalytic subunit